MALFIMATSPTSQKPDHEIHHPPYETLNIARKATGMTLIKQRHIGKIGHLISKILFVNFKCFKEKSIFFTVGNSNQ